MADNYPGCYLSVNLGDAPADPSGVTLDIAGLNFAIVDNEDDQPIDHRFTTWGMQAETGILYQNLGEKNRIIIGKSGKLYELTEASWNDDGVPINTYWQSGPLPELSNDTPVEAQKRIHEFWWQTAFDPPSSGQVVLVSFFDVDSTVAITRRIVQTSRKVRVLTAVTLAPCFVQEKS